MAGLRDGTFAYAKFHSPVGVCTNAWSIYVADRDNHAIRELDLRSGCVKTILKDGTWMQSPTDVIFCKPYWLHVCARNEVFCLDLRTRTLSLLAIGRLAKRFEGPKKIELIL